MSTALSVLGNHVQQFFDDPPTIRRELAPTDEQRGALEARKQEIEICLTPCGPLDAAEAILKMFDGWPTMRMDLAKSRSVGAIYVAATRGLPLWSLDAAIRELQGRKSPFPPSSGELAAAAREYVSSFADEAKLITKILFAQVVDPTPKSEAAKRRVAAAARSLGMYKPPSAPDYRQRRDMLAEASLAGIDYAKRPVIVGDALRAKLNLAEDVVR